MRVAIVHYHLRRGGVCRVIENTIPELLKKGIQVALLAETASDLSPELRQCFIPVAALAYQNGAARIAPNELAQHLRAAAAQRLGGTPDLWHIHNHHLGKNTSLTEVVASFASAGERLLLHIHDFPEDGRATNYQTLRADLGARLAQSLYPIGENVVYGVLNRRDYELLLRAKIPSKQLALLPNPIVVSPIFAKNNRLKTIAYDQLFLYPTRAIARKNLGEVLLWAAVASPGQSFGCTLAPENPLARPLYDRWVNLANALKLPVEFELAKRLKLPFAELVSASHRLVTTSIAEGFGLTFLEPWLFERSLFGRNLPEITADFIDAGLRLDGLYDRLEIPIDWIDFSRLKKELANALERMFAQYAMKLPKGHLALTLADLVRAGRVDFGRLSEEMQRSVIERIAKDNSMAKAMCPSEMSEMNMIRDARADFLLRSNHRVVKNFFNANRYGKLLIDVYDHLAKASTSKIQWADPKAILRQFLCPSQFAFLKI